MSFPTEELRDFGSLGANEAVTVCVSREDFGQRPLRDRFTGRSGAIGEPA